LPNLTNIYSRHAHFIERYKTGQYNRLKPFLNRAIRSLSDELLKTNTVTSQLRIEAKLKLIEQIMVNELSGFTDDFQEQLRLFAESEAGFGIKSMGQFVTADFVNPSPAQLWAAVNARPFNNKLLKDSLNEFTTLQSRLVRDTVSTGFFEGKTTQEIVRQIVGTKSQNFKNGILEVTRNSASRMVRTAINHTASVAKDKLFQDNSDIAPYYEWVSTLDSRTSLTCMSLDGKIFTVGKGKLPPAHFNCRSTTAPLLIGEFTIKNGVVTKDSSNFTRASIDGQVDSDLNYNDWLKKQSKAFQIEALGPARAKLFREGGLTVDKFTDRLDSPLNLNELEQKYPLAFGKADI
jgi:SPP1 gp7 family putative phage head morphogenesis protein